jgi:quinol-cytochrome oxidoreductase complex cytochrome b subunit
MTESPDPTASAPDPAAAPPPYGAPAPAGGVPAPAMSAPLAPMAGPADGPLGKIRGTGMCVLLTIVTLGFYTWYWYYKTHDEMKQHTGNGIGGPIALIITIFVSIVMPFLNSNEVGGLYERKGLKKPVSAATGLWFLLLGWFFLIGAIVWFVKTNGALNEYWKSQGATA